MKVIYTIHDKPITKGEALPILASADSKSKLANLIGCNAKALSKAIKDNQKSSDYRDKVALLFKDTDIVVSNVVYYNSNLVVEAIEI